MKEFILRGKKGCYIAIAMDEVYGFPHQTSHYGGYDIRGTIEVKSGNYYVKGELWFSTGEIYNFYNQLRKINDDLDGVASFINGEANFKLEVIFNKRGQVNINGYFKEFHHEENELKFEIESNQSFFIETLDGLKKIVKKYGDMTGTQLD